VVPFYNKRGTAEQWIKEGKQAVKMTRLTCNRFRCNEVRLWLSVLAEGGRERLRSQSEHQLPTWAPLAWAGRTWMRFQRSEADRPTGLSCSTWILHF